METPEEEPRLKLTMNGEEIYATRDNTTLFQFFGHLAMYDHVFVQLNDDSEEVARGAYLFNNQAIFDDLVDFIVTNEYPQHVCMREVAQCDVDAWNQTMFADLINTDSFPEEWADGTS